jgi:hypothetical protein
MMNRVTGQTCLPWENDVDAAFRREVLCGLQRATLPPNSVAAFRRAGILSSFCPDSHEGVVVSDCDDKVRTEAFSKPKRTPDPFDRIEQQYRDGNWVSSIGKREEIGTTPFLSAQTGFSHPRHVFPATL